MWYIQGNNWCCINGIMTDCVHNCVVKQCLCICSVIIPQISRSLGVLRLWDSPVGVFYELAQHQISRTEFNPVQRNLPNTKQARWLTCTAKSFLSSSLHNCSNLVEVTANYSPKISSVSDLILLLEMCINKL